MRIFITCILFNLCCVAYAAPLKGNNNACHNRSLYFEMGFGYQVNVANSSTNTYKIFQHPVPGSATLNYKNSNVSLGPNVQIGLGYQWHLNNDWTWSIGANFSHSLLSQEGSSQLVGMDGENSYSYNIYTTNLSLVGRIIYKWKKWRPYAELQLGGVWLNSNSYTNDSFRDKFASKTILNLSYGVGIGVMRTISSVTSVGLKVNYNAFGIAKLGERLSPGASQSVGQVAQRVNTISTMLTVMHWF